MGTQSTWAQAQTLTFLWDCRKALRTRSRGPLRWMMTHPQMRTRKHLCRHNRFEQLLGTTEYQLQVDQWTRSRPQKRKHPQRKPRKRRKRRRRRKRRKAKVGRATRTWLITCLRVSRKNLVGASVEPLRLMMAQPQGRRIRDPACHHKWQKICVQDLAR